MTGVVLSLCDRTGVMVQPWLDAGYEAITVDLQGVYDERCALAGWTIVGGDVREFTPPDDVAIVFAFPPCTHLAVSGARWWRDKGPAVIGDALSIVDACWRICVDSGAPWMIENPVGRLSTLWCKPDFLFDPYEFAGWADAPDAEAYTKRTCLWTGGGFVLPDKRPHPLGAIHGSLFHRTPPSADRGDVRSVTPQGFARAVFDANQPALEAVS